MTTPPDSSRDHRRVLIVDDNTAIHDDFKRILGPPETAAGDVDAEAAFLFGGPAIRAADFGYELDFATQGQQAHALVRAAREQNQPYSLAFADMRMPPGWDGLETIQHLWQADPGIQTVICTAYSDRSWEEIRSALAAQDRWLVLKKPFDPIEVLQLANSLTEKWRLARLAAANLESLEALVTARTSELVAAHRVKCEFLTNASHELLTPMNAICGYLDFLADTPLAAEPAAFVQEARQAGQHLHRLIRQMLDFNEAEAGMPAVSAAAFAPHEILARVVERHADTARAKGLQLRSTIRSGTDPSWVGPAEAVEKTLNLLTDNAIKFTP